ncbi:hypothetical protein MKW98_015408 [Papaver atlanticum]|uniref:non-specific serine/threonine protein kinase n=1 Tax=Papaver atlanticum TaxID=357466 RepID=A0AAD4RY96_9MAGN|nr:hypothetical protein MKW98_015408 [Papaver atlanticum]
MSELILHSNSQGFGFESQSKVIEESRSANPRRVGKHSEISNHNLRNNPPRGSINFTNEQFVNILQSMGQGLHIIDPEGLIVYWNRSSEQIFGYSASEDLGQNINGFIVEKQDLGAANEIIEKNSSGENWTGIFPSRNKQGQQFEVLVTTAPLYDDRGTLVGIICVTIASESTQKTTEPVSLGTKPLEDDTYPSSSWLRNSGPTTTRHVLDPCHKPLKAVIPSKISKLTWRSIYKLWSKRKSFEATLSDHRADASLKNLCPRNSFGNSRVKGISWSWENQQILQVAGSCATVYRGLWCSTDVAIKVIINFEYYDNLLMQHSFRQEVLVMKRLRHPNVVLFMGAVTSPRNLCIITEFLPRGSLFQVLRRRTTTTLDWRRRVLIALDIARGMNYLHCYNPPIIHRDLKSSNLFVDKNWSVKVGDFGLSRFKHQTFLTSAGNGTPQWMAPEVIRNEPADEKSDVYSFGVVLRELATLKVPWNDLTSMQVIAAVGFMNQRNEIPKDTDLTWASLIERCWHSDPKCRPTFAEVLEKLKIVQRHYFVQKPTYIRPRHVPV